jgi:hypothetical protein
VEEEISLEMKNFDGNHNIELDIYLPKEKLALEYQGEQHFKQIYGIEPQLRQKERQSKEKIVF